MCGCSVGSFLGWAIFSRRRRAISTKSKKLNGHSRTQKGSNGSESANPFSKARIQSSTRSVGGTSSPYRESENVVDGLSEIFDRSLTTKRLAFRLEGDTMTVKTTSSESEIEAPSLYTTQAGEGSSKDAEPRKIFKVI